MAKHTCPACEAEHDQQTPVEGELRELQRGDIMVCWDCGLACTYDGRGKLIPMSPEELAELDAKSYSLVRAVQDNVWSREPKKEVAEA